MKILLSGPIEGDLKSFYEHARAQEPHWIVCAGDFGIWPDPHRMDRAARKHAGKDFSRYYVGAMEDLPEIRIPTLTLAGVHDDNRWLNYRQTCDNVEILNNVHWLSQGYRTTIGFDGPPVRVTGLGRAYSESTYSGEGSKRSHRHYTRRDVERACSSGPTDLLVLYEEIDAPGIRNVIFATRPQLILNVQHANRKAYSEVQGIPIVQLARKETKTIEWKNGCFYH
jgi:hypothetical protein